MWRHLSGIWTHINPCCWYFTSWPKFLPFSVLEVNIVFSNFDVAKTSQHGWKEHLKVSQVCQVYECWCLVLKTRQMLLSGVKLRLWSSLTLWNYSGYVTLFTILQKKLKHQLNFENNGPLFLFETIFRHWKCFLSSVAMDCKNGHGLKREKIGPTFLSFNALSAKMTKNYYCYG